MDVDQALKDCASWTALPDAHEAARVLAKEVLRLRVRDRAITERVWTTCTDAVAAHILTGGA